MRSRDPDLEARWRERVEAWRASGLTAAQFAARNDFSASALCSWASRLRKSVASRVHSAPAFVPVVRADADSPREMLVEVGPARVRVARGFDPDLLAAVVRAIGGAS